MANVHTFNWSSFSERLVAVATECGFTGVTLGHTLAGPVMAWEKAGKGPTVYISAGIHGDEPAGPLAVMELLETGFFNTPLNWRICPALNPTGLASGKRDSDLGIDLNRDYFLRVSSEVAAHARWIEQQHPPDLFLSLHEDWEVEKFFPLIFIKCFKSTYAGFFLF